MLSSQIHIQMCFLLSVPPVVSVSHAEEEEEQEVDVEEEECKPCQSKEEEASTSYEHMKQGVRNNLRCWHIKGIV